MSTVSTFVPDTIKITDKAIKQVKHLISEEDNTALKLRVFITGGGCSGFQYGFTFDENCAEDDAQIEQDGVTVLIDSMSYPYLLGSTLDYQEGLQGARFSVNNPNATSTCGCGASFAI